MPLLNQHRQIKFLLKRLAHSLILRANVWSLSSILAKKRTNSLLEIAPSYSAKPLCCIIFLVF